MVAFVQPAIQGPEDLAVLLSRNLVINPELANNLQEEQQQQQQQQESSNPRSGNPALTSANNPPATAPIVYSISQHYHHSAHIARPQQSQPEQHIEQHQPERPSSEPPQTEQESCENILRNHGIDSSALNPPQLQLFRIADEEQKMRLIQLWSIVPPRKEGDDPSLAWTSTTVEREEQLARMRLDTHMQAQIAQQAQLQAQGGMALDGAQGQDGRWNGPQHYQHYMEPYMANGYDELMRREAAERQFQQRQAEEDRPRDVYSHFGTSVGGPTYKPATDPVYKGTNFDWEVQMQMQMENQYGSFEASRGQAGTADAMEIL